MKRLLPKDKGLKGADAPTTPASTDSRNGRIKVLSVHNKLGHANIPLENFLKIDPETFELDVLGFYQDQTTVEQFIRTVYPNAQVQAYGLDCDSRGVRSLFEVVSILRRINPDVIHLHHTLSAALIALVARLCTRAKVLTTLHNDFPTHRFLQKVLLLVAMGLSHMVVCNSKSTLKSLGRWRRMILRRKRFRVSYNGVDLEKIEQGLGSAPRPHHEESQKPFTVGSVARLCEQKDFPTLLKGFARFHARRRNSRLIIVGDGPLRSDLEALAESLNIRASVSFPGEIPRRDVYASLPEMDVFVVSSRWEGFCNAMVEAMAAGKAVVATNLDVLVEVLGEECGSFFNVGDDNQLAERLEALYVDKPLRETLGKAARRRAKEKYGLEACAASHSSCYRELVQTAPLPSRPPRIQTLCQLPFRILTSPYRAFPSFLIIGVRKGGTTSLFAYLNSHPHVLPCLVKEPHFFDLHFGYGDTIYRACFPSQRQVRKLKAASSCAVHWGEASTCYIYYPQVPQRVKDVLPEGKFILLLRNPVERAFSHYEHNKRHGIETRSFEDAIEEELSLGPAGCLDIKRAEANGSQHHRYFCYLSRGLYFEQIKNWHSVFPKEQMLIIKSEDLFRNTATEFRKVLAFLGLEDWQPEEGFRPYNVGVKGRLDPRTRDRLAPFYKPPNEQLYDYLGVDYGW